MQKVFVQIQKNWQNLSFIKENFNPVIHKYSLYAAEEIIEENEKNQQAFNNIKKSNIIIIGKYIKDSNCNSNCFFACFNETIIFINNPSSFHLLRNIFTCSPKLNICFLNGKKDDFDENCKIIYHNIINDFQFNDKVIMLRNELKIKSHKFDTQTEFFLKSIFNCISALLLKNAYYKLPKNRIEDFFNDSLSRKKEYPLQKKISTNDYVQLNQIGCGSFFVVFLIYHIEKEQLFALKKIKRPDSEEDKELLEKEIEICRKLKHPLIPQFIGVTTKNHIVIEYISGKTLFDKKYLNDENMLNSFLQILIIIEYIHNNNYIYRDLKGDNVMIDDYNNAVLIDLNSLILEKDDIKSKTVFNIHNPGDSYWGDIRTIGDILFLMMNKNNNLYMKYPKLKIVLMKCQSDYNEEIPTTFSIIRLIIFYYHYKIKISHFDDLLKMNIKKAKENISENEDHHYRKIILSLIYLDEIINKSGQSLTNAKKMKYQNRYDKAKNVLKQMDDLKYKEPEFVLNKINNSSVLGNAIFLYGESNKGSNFDLNCLYLNFRENEIDPKNCFESLLENAHNNNPDAQYIVSFVYFHLVDYVVIDQKYNRLFSDQYYNETDTKKLVYILHKICNAVHQNIYKGFIYLNLAVKNLQVNALHIYGRIHIAGCCKYNELDERNKYFYIMLAQNPSNNKIFFDKIKHFSKYINCNAATGIEYLQQAAKQKDIGSIFLLSQIYCSGEVVSRDMEKVIYYLKLAIEQNNSAAKLQLGCIYHFGIYVDQNIPLGIHYLKLSADQGNSIAQFIMFNLYLENDENIGINEKQALYYIQKAAEQDFPDAQLELGILYMRKIFSSLKYADIFEITKSLKTSYFEGFNKFSKIKDLTFENDYKKGFEYIEKAAKQNHPNSQCIIGQLYLNGIPRVVTKNVDLAIQYFLLAANQNNYVAQYFLGTTFHEMKGREKEGIKYLQLSAENNYSIAQYELGLIFSDKTNPDYNIENAIKYLELASNKGNSQAQCKLGYIYYLKKYGKYNMEKAISYFTKSANNECEDAQYILGIFYLNGKYVKQSIGKGIELIKQSIKGDSTEGNFAYGYLLNKGEFIEKNIPKSITYYIKASNTKDIYSKNNLGALYKKENMMRESFHYFNDAIQLYNDEVVMYNLAHNYLYENGYQINIQDSIIDLLIRSMNKGFHESKMLLGIALIKIYGFNIVHIEHQLKKFNNLNHEQVTKVLLLILNQNLLNQSIFNMKYEQYRNMYYLYDYNLNPISMLDFDMVKPRKNIQKCTKYDINSNFYEGFGDIIMPPS